MSSVAACGLAPGSRIVVAGGCGGIGRVLVQHLLDARCEVAVLDREAALLAHVPPASVPAIAMDVTHDHSVTAAAAAVAARWPAADGFVNLCGYSEARTPLASMPVTTFEQQLAVNLTGAMRLCSALLPLLRRADSASIVHLASTLAVRTTPGYGGYAAAKAGLLSLTRTLALELAPRIRVNAVAPSAVETEFLTGGTGRDARASQFDRATYAAAVPLGRLATPADVVGPVTFLLGTASAYMTGQVLHVNGGQYLA